MFEDPDEPDMIPHIDLSALDGATVRLEMRLKNGSFAQVENYGTPEETRTEFFVDTPWTAAPVFSPGMHCPDKSFDEHILGQNEDCDLCCEKAGEECEHGFTICAGECIDSWAQDWYFRTGLVVNGEVTEWFGLNDVPGYKSL